MNFCQARVIISLTFILNYYCSSAQNDTLKIQRNLKNKVTFASFKPSSSVTLKMNNDLMFLKTILQARDDDELRLTEEWTDKTGTRHKRYQQFYKGIKVEYSNYLVHGMDNNINYINGSFEDVSLSSVVPALSEKDALIYALNFVGAKKYKWEDEKYESFIKENSNDLTATHYPKGKMVICKNYLKGGSTSKLSWSFAIASLIPNNAQLIFVDANTGEIINQQPLTYDLNASGTAQTTYSGSQGITGDSFTGGFRLHENRNGVGIETRSMKNITNIANAVDFVDNDNNWTAAEFANSNHDQAALDVHWASEVVLDYWDQIHNRNSYNTIGSPLKNYVHYSQNPNGANWDQLYSVLFYGDGNGTSYNPFATLDIVAHEFGHAVCISTSNLAYVGAESSALNEGFSDIWGAAVEAYGAPGKQRWLLGEDNTLTTPGFERSMSNPHDGISARADTYHGTFWEYNTSLPGVYAHANMGVLSHWFYLLTTGGSGWNNGQTSHAAANDGYQWNVLGTGITDAETIAYLTERNLSNIADYLQARNVSIQAAITLFGYGSCQEISVTNAWYAVGVGTAYSGNAGLNVSGDNVVCSTSNMYTIPNLPSGTTVHWVATPSGAVTVNSPNSTQTTITRNFDGVISLTATISNVCGSLQIGTTKGVQVGPPPTVTDIIGMDPSVYLSAGQYLTLHTDVDADSYSWTIGGATVIGSSTSSYITVQLDQCFYNQHSNNIFSADVVVSNSCGYNQYGEYTFARCDGDNGDDPPLRLAINPNPVTDNVYAELNIDELIKTKKISETDKVTAKLYDLTRAQFVRQWTLAKDQKINRLSVSGLRKGQYVLQVTVGSNNATKQISIE